MTEFEIVLLHENYEIGVKRKALLPCIPRKGDQIFIPIYDDDHLGESDHLEEDFYIQHNIRTGKTQVIVSSCDLDFIASMVSKSTKWVDHEFFMSQKGKEQLVAAVQAIQK